MNPIYKIYRSNNYVYIYDVDNNKLYQEHSFRVLVKKDTLDGEMYNISFLRPETTPGAFYTINWQQLIDIYDAPFGSQTDWEEWYQDNTGDVGVTASSTGDSSCANAQAIGICNEQYTVMPTPILLIESGTIGIISNKVLSISFASNGTAPALISFDSGGTFKSIPVGTTINMDAGAFSWHYTSNVFQWDTSAVGASLIITFNHL